MLDKRRAFVSTFASLAIVTAVGIPLSAMAEEGNGETEIVRGTDPIPVDVPVVEDIVYDGQDHTPLIDNEFWTASGYYSTGHDALSEPFIYKTELTLRDGYIWSENRNTSPVTVCWTIVPRPITITPDDVTVFEGEPQPTLTASVENGLTTESVPYALGRQDGDEAGTYTISVNVDRRRLTNYNITTKTGTYTILGKIDEPAQSGNLTYTGSEQTVSLTGSGYEVVGGDKATDIGTHTAQVKPDSIHRWQDGTDEVRNVEWSIDPISIVDATVTLPDKNPTYMGGQQVEIHPTVTLDGKELKEGVDYEIIYLTGCEIGRQQLAIHGIGIYTGYATDAAIDYTIDRGILEIPQPTERLVYNGEEQACPIPERKGYYRLSGELSATQPGEYTVTVTLLAWGFYDWPDGTTEDKIVKWYIDEKPADETAMTGSDEKTDNVNAEDTNSDKTDDSSTEKPTGDDKKANKATGNSTAKIAATGDAIPIEILVGIVAVSGLAVLLASRKQHG